ncbi:MAG: neutral zinc metallopeptidase [Chloroflexota bacterium]|nr:neutral zinc metallopeptidase [Chloroflexota bacterium]
MRRVMAVLLFLSLFVGWTATPAAAAPLAASYTATATIAPLAPRTGTSPTVSGTLRSGGKGVSGARLTATWHLPGGAATCSATTSSSGLAHCSYRLTGVATDAAVTVDLAFRSSKGTLLASKHLTFHEGTTLQDIVKSAGDSINSFWRVSFAASGLTFYGPATFQSYATRIRTGCGRAPLDNAFYCDSDNKVYYDLALFNSEAHDYGNFAPVVILAHEWGHVVQRNLNIDESAYYGAEIELQADCFAGVYVRHVQAIGALHTGDLQAATAALYSAGDDLAVTNPHHHGNPDERVQAFNTGLTAGFDGCSLP